MASAFFRFRLKPSSSEGGLCYLGGMPTIRLTRTDFFPDRTLGTLEVMEGDKVLYRCLSLELPWNDNKRRTSCIPKGAYPIVWEYSNSFKRELYELKDVPNRDEVKIHGANYPKQLLGCIAPCLQHADIDHDGLLDAASSRAALEAIHKHMGGVKRSTIEVV